MRKAVVQYGQTLADIAIQEYGSADAVVALIRDNPGLVQNWHDIPVPGTVIYIKTAPVNPTVQQYYANLSLKPANVNPAYDSNNTFDYTLDFALS